MSNAKHKERYEAHGMSRSSIYRRWNGMKQRCNNPKATAYKNYGGRGITICDEWQNSFQAFYDYVSKLPHYGEPGYSLDRIDNDGNYEPGNVRWTTMLVQQNNKSTSSALLRSYIKNLHTTFP